NRVVARRQILELVEAVLVGHSLLLCFECGAQQENGRARNREALGRAHRSRDHAAGVLRARALVHELDPHGLVIRWYLRRGGIWPRTASQRDHDEPGREPEREPWPAALELEARTDSLGLGACDQLIEAGVIELGDLGHAQLTTLTVSP